MRPDSVVVPSPTLDDDLGFAQRIEDLAAEKLIAQARAEAFDKAVLPRTAGRDVSGLRADGGDPFLRRLGEELRAERMCSGMPAQDEQIRQYVDDVDRFEPAGHPNGQALTGELVDDVEQAKFASAMSALLEEVVGPDVVGALGPQPDAGSVTQPQPGALGLPGGDLQPLASPDALDPLVVDQPAGPAQQLGNLAIAIAAIL